MTNQRQILKIVLCSLLAASTVAMKDPATGISFDSESRARPIFGVGARKKGPIKVYSVGMYGSEDLKEELSSISRSESKGKKAVDALRKGASNSSTAFVLKMNFKVGSEKMAQAIADSVKPRHSSDEEVGQLKDIIFEGVQGKGAAVKGTVIEFDCSDTDGVEVTVDGKGCGKVSSPGLAKALCDVYLDDKAVSPKLKESILENCCAE
ncbi:unnamed protein product [Pseudo-nitzschia multistriata]|uniref:Chalcone isomerase domain-containing protein n=1 Tax=Pseudo-nitzschia multistriata TaxID=183589 RepID=A0A448Z195_9STRA|nr:unnamed protein product [Pseudo-nitzschia multistriata]